MQILDYDPYETTAGDEFVGFTAVKYLLTTRGTLYG